MNKFSMFADDAIIVAQKESQCVRLWGPYDTDLSWVKFIDLSGRCIEVKSLGKQGRRHYIECSVDILPIMIGDMMVLHGDLGDETAYNCTVHAEMVSVPKLFPYECSIRLGTRA